MQTKIALFSAAAISLLAIPLHANVELHPLTSVIQSDFRQTKNVQRDVYRHPRETLKFMGIKPTDTVVELWPGGGWYAEILGPYLADKGQYVAASFNIKPAKKNARTQYRAKVGEQFELWLHTNKTQMKGAKVITFDPPIHMVLGDENSADVVLTFRNLHNWAMSNQLAATFQSAYQVLKPGGTFGVVEHRANRGMNIRTGYMDQTEMIKAAKNVGFVLAAKSEINANNKDLKAYPKGVWTLPPSLAMGDENKAAYLAIGESDRMTLKFVKPIQNQTK